MDFIFLVFSWFTALRNLQIVCVTGFVPRDPLYGSAESGDDARDPVGVRKS